MGRVSAPGGRVRPPLLPCLRAGRIEAGVDEAGRGPLAGPVVAAAVILPPGIEADALPGLDDSKRMTAARREALAPKIKEAALAWAVAEVSAEEIDRLNILRASILAMHRALRKLAPAPRFIVVDGNRFRPFYADFEEEDVDAAELRLHDEASLVGHSCVVGGDGKYMSVAAASVLAKTRRDEIMAGLDAQYPGYGWARNMGYPTREHYEALRRLGPTPLHRMTFNLKLPSGGAR